MEPSASLVIRRVPLDTLHLDPSNARLHDEVNLDAIRGSLARFGQAEPLVVQKATGRIVGGNGRYVVMKALGWTEADVVELELTDLQATALGIALNRTGELASWDESTLAKLLEELHAEDALDGIGYSESDLDAILDELQRAGGDGSDGDADQIPEPPDAATTRRGDLWVLGDHRLLCGDSSSEADLDRLLSGQPIHLVNTDPPYNVKVEPRSNNAIMAGNSSFEMSPGFVNRGDAGKPTADHGKRRRTSKMRAKDRPLANDFLDEDSFNDLLAAWFGNIARVLEPGRGFYIWGGYSNLGNYPQALKAAGLYFSQGIIWDKEHPVLTRKDFMGAFEIAYYGWREGAAHQFFGPNNATDLWHVKKVTPQSMIHLTEKPVELARRALLYSSRRGENILDLFGGSGSTLMAAQDTERRAFLMELDEAYADVIVMRWCQATGQDAVLDGDGRTFDEVKRARAAEVEAEPASEPEPTP